MFRPEPGGSAFADAGGASKVSYFFCEVLGALEDCDFSRATPGVPDEDVSRVSPAIVGMQAGLWL